MELLEILFAEEGEIGAGLQKASSQRSKHRRNGRDGMPRTGLPLTPLTDTVVAKPSGYISATSGA
jgi:hypothetical protein